MKNKLNSLRNKLKNGDVLIGPFMKTSDPAFVESAGYGGFDFVILDMEHGPMNVLQMQNLIRAAECVGVTPIIRVPECNETAISKVLDIGAKGVQVPQITSKEQAKEAINVAKFSPIGERGVCRYVRAAKYSSMDKFEYFKEANDNIMILQLEGEKALKNVDDIITVEGIDIIFIGPYDLSQSLGYAGQVDHPIVIEKMKYIIKKAKQKNITVGVFVDNLEGARFWKNKGVQYISFSVDVGIFYEGCKSIVDDFKQL